MTNLCPEFERSYRRSHLWPHKDMHPRPYSDQIDTYRERLADDAERLFQSPTTTRITVQFRELLLGQTGTNTSHSRLSRGLTKREFFSTIIRNDTELKEHLGDTSITSMQSQKPHPQCGQIASRKDPMCRFVCVS